MSSNPTGITTTLDNPTGINTTLDNPTGEQSFFDWSLAHISGKKGGHPDLRLLFVERNCF